MLISRLRAAACRRRILALVPLLAALSLPAASAPSRAAGSGGGAGSVPAARLAVLARGVNIAHWLRFPPRDDDASLAGYVSDASLRALKRDGFTYLRLPVGLEVVMDGQRIRPDRLQVLLGIVKRIQAAGLGAMIEPHPQSLQNWDFAHNGAARAALFGFWHDLAPRLRGDPAALTFPELVNEPTIDAAAWNDMQHRLAGQIRADLPHDTIILTGSNWGSLDGLLKVTPLADPDVVYSFHSYEPTLLTTLGFWDNQIDHAALAAHIPFPATAQACHAATDAIAQPHTRQVMQYWCSLKQNEASFRAYLARATAWGRQHGVAVALTEFGASGELNPPARNAYFTAMRQAAGSLGLPWGVWALDDQMGFGLTGSDLRGTAALPAPMTRDLALPG